MSAASLDTQDDHDRPSLPGHHVSTVVDPVAARPALPVQAGLGGADWGALPCPLWPPTRPWKGPSPPQGSRGLCATATFPLSSLHPSPGSQMVLFLSTLEEADIPGATSPRSVFKPSRSSQISSSSPPWHTALGPEVSRPCPLPNSYPSTLMGLCLMGHTESVPHWRRLGQGPQSPPGLLHQMF